jgi:hypothetical protein
MYVETSVHRGTELQLKTGCLLQLEISRVKGQEHGCDNVLPGHRVVLVRFRGAAICKGKLCYLENILPKNAFFIRRNQHELLWD